MQIVNLQIAPTSVKPVVHVSQSDVGRQFQLRLFDGAVAYSLPSGTTARIDGIKPDKEGFSYTDATSVSGNTVTVTTKTQMTTTPGNVECEIRLVNNNADIGTLNFIMLVEESPLSDVDISKTDLPDLIAEVRAAADTAAASATSASNSAESASGSATSATTAATSASTNGLKAEGYAVGKQNGTDVSSESDYYHNNARYYAEIARSLSANPPYIGNNGNWYVWSTNAGAYVDSEIDASITVNIADITMLATNENPYITNTGTDTDPIFHLFIPRGAGIQSIAKTATSGLVDTYTITFTDGQTTTYTVTNGAKGDIGDSAGFGTPTASVDANVGTPSVTVTATGPNTAKVFDFVFSNLKGETGERGPQGATGNTGNGIDSITKTATQGLVDTYTIAFTNGTTTTFTVTNGQNGTGAGDMLATDYDPTLAVYDAGGIVAYVADQLSGLSISLNGLTDVALNNLAAGQTLAYNATSQKWENTSLAAVATSGSYADLSNKPTLGNAASKDSTNAVTQNSTDLVESGAVYTEVSSLNTAIANEVETRAKLGAHNLWYELIPATGLGGGTYTLADHVYSISAPASSSSGIYWSTTALRDFYANKVGVAAKISFDVKADATINAYVGLYNNKASLTTSYQHIEQDIADLSQIDAFKVYNRDTAAAHTISLKNVMVTLPTDGYDGFTPYAPTNAELLPADTNAVLGAHNLVANNAVSGTANTIQFTVNSNKTITVNGTSSSNSPQIFAINTGFSLPVGRYVLTGTPSGAWSSGAGFRLQVYNTTKSVEFYDMGNGVAFDVTDSSDVLLLRIWYSANASITSKTFAPMIRIASDPSTAYAPYAMTNRELTEINSLIFGKGLSISQVSDINALFAGTSDGFSVNMFSSNNAQAPNTAAGIVITYVRTSAYGVQIAMNYVGLYFRANNNNTISSWQKLSL